MDIKVLIEAAGRPWYIEPQAAAHYASIVQQLFDRQAITAFADDEPLELAYAVNASAQRIGTVAEANSEGVAVINMRGPVMKYDFCGSPGTQSMIKAIEQANANPAIQGIVLQIDSPGGTTDGTEEFANAVKASKKPVVAFTNGMMASAAMWIGSAAAMRIASANTNIVGSIGTMAKWKNYKKAEAAAGIENHEVYASASTQKNLGFREAEQNGNYEPLITQVLDPLNNEFTAAIQANIPGADPSVLSGATYTAKEARKKGLIDKMGSLHTAVTEVMKLAKNSATKMQNLNQQFANVLAAAGAESVYENETFFGLTEEQLAAVEAHLVQINSGLAATTEQLDAANTALGTANQTIETLEAEVARLKNADAAPASDAAAGADAYNTPDPKAKYLTSVDQEMAERKLKYGV